MAIPIIMGQNIGTCVTALISSIGVNRNAKRVSVIHISFNLIGTFVCLILFYGGDLLFGFEFLRTSVGAVGVALCHTIFNLFTTIILLPFSRQLEKLARKTVKDDTSAEQFAFLDPLLMRTPGVAISECVSMTIRMGQLAHESVLLALQQIYDYREERASEIEENEDKLDIYEDRLGGYLIQLSQHGVSMKDIHTVSRLLHAIGDFERVGDHALNIQESAQELHEKGLSFSETANKEIKILIAALEDTLEKAFSCFAADDPKLALEVEPLEETIDVLIEEIRVRHIARLQRGECTVQLGFVLSDLLTNMERVSDHCSNIAMTIVEEQGENVNRHAYLSNLHVAGEFASTLNRDLEKYRLP